MCTCISTWIYVHPDCPYLLHPACIVWWKLCVSLYGSVFVSQSPHFCSHTLFRTCTCISTWIYVHLTVHVCSLPLCIVSWKLGCPYLSLCLCPIHPACVPTPCLKCVHASLHEFMSTLLPMTIPSPMHSLMETCVPLYGSVFVSQSPNLCSYILFRMCTMHQYINLGHPDFPYLVHPLCIVWWKLGIPVCQSAWFPFTSFVPTPCLECVHASVHEFVCHLTVLIWYSPYAYCDVRLSAPCMAVCLCPSQLISDPTPCLECVHASVYKFMSTWLSMSGPHPLHSLMETCVPLYGSVFMFQSSNFSSHTLFRMCTCISTWYFCLPYLLMCSSAFPMHSFMETWVPLFVTVCVSQSPCLCFHTLFRMCTCISTWI